MFWSIISDYDLKTGLCELIDNAIEFGSADHKSKPPRIEVTLDAERQLISVKDKCWRCEIRKILISY